MYFTTVVSFCVIGAVLGACPEGQIEYECKPCIQSCVDRTIQNNICTKICTKGCACPINTITDANGKCLAPETCPFVCTKRNELFFAFPQCVPQCHQTCDSYLLDGPKPQACTDQCISNQCGCPQGNYIDKNGNCVTEQQCKNSTKCESGEYFYSSSDGIKCAPCRRTCDNYYKSNAVCTLECAINICRCAHGYVKNGNEKGCIPADQCPINANCGKNAMVRWNGGCAPCARTCDNYHKEEFPCPLSCNKEQCVCKDGFVRNANKQCVPISECPKPTCGPGEKFYGPNECRPCEDRCTHLPLNPDKIYCTRECISNVCSCQKGFKRDQEGRCVESCPMA